MAVLTDTKARAMQPGSAALPHGGIVGLTLIPSKMKGHGKWVLRYVSPTTGKRRNLGLGPYPEVGIAAATEHGRKYREQLAAGIDPLEVKKAAVPDIQIPNFQEAAQLLHQELLPSWKNLKHRQQWINTLKQYAYPIIGNMLVSKIEPSHVADVLRPIWLEKEETASRVKQRIHAVLDWAWAHKYISANPVDVVKFLLPVQPDKEDRTEHYPAMPWRDIPKFFVENLSRDLKERSVTKNILEFLILTACRSNEARGMRWEEVDWENSIWKIPAARMKKSRSHNVPLSSQALEILKAQQGKDEAFVFPSPFKGVELSDMVLTTFLRKVKAHSDTPGRYATAHGFRSSFRDWCSENRYERDLAKRALAHKIKDKVDAAYHRTDLLQQRRPLMQRWADYVTGTVIREKDRR